MLVPLALLLIAFGAPSYGQYVNYTPLQYELGRPILLNCSVSTTQAPPPGGSYPITWSKNGTDIEHVEELKNRYEKLEQGTVLRVGPRSRQEDYGDYECRINGELHGWRLHALPIAKLRPALEAVEGQTVKVICKLVGKPYPPVDWLYGSAMVPVEEVAGSRVTLRDNEYGVPRGELMLAEVTQADAGTYSCQPRGGNAAYTILHVRSQGPGTAGEGQKPKMNCNCTCSCG